MACSARLNLSDSSAVDFGSALLFVSVARPMAASSSATSLNAWEECPFTFLIVSLPCPALRRAVAYASRRRRLIASLLLSRFAFSLNQSVIKCILMAQMFGMGEHHQP